MREFHSRQNLLSLAILFLSSLSIQPGAFAQDEGKKGSDDIKKGRETLSRLFEALEAESQKPGANPCDVAVFPSGWMVMTSS